MIDGRIVIKRAWRSQIGRLLAFAVLMAIGLGVSRVWPGSIISGELFHMGNAAVILRLPIALLPGFCALIFVIIPIFDAKLIMDKRGVEMESGILNFNYYLARVRYEDIRGVDLDQTVLERFLNIGSVSIGTAATEGIEIFMTGIASPRAVQELIQRERDARQRADAKKATPDSVATEALYREVAHGD
jgi:uncharacterized membrane protein YdbT with pleckstrin-like domain